MRISTFKLWEPDMPLRIRLATDERIIVNGAVIRNSDKRSILTIENKANVLRGKDIMFLDQADTLPKKVYYLVQNMLITPVAQDKDTSARVTGLMAELFGRENAQGWVIEAMDHFSNGDYYKTLVALKEIISLENERSKSLQFEETQHVVTDEPADCMAFIR